MQIVSPQRPLQAVQLAAEFQMDDCLFSVLIEPPLPIIIPERKIEILHVGELSAWWTPD